MDEQNETPQAIAERLGIGQYQRHVFLCTGPKCCSSEVGELAWETLKRELKDRGLSLSAEPNACFRTKVGCLRVCAHGPIAVVYPEGTWYSGLTADRIPLFIERHLENDLPIEEWIFARNQLPNHANQSGAH